MRNTLIQSKVIEHATNTMGDTVEDMDTETDQKDKYLEILGKK